MQVKDHPAESRLPALVSIRRYLQIGLDVLIQASCLAILLSTIAPLLHASALRASIVGAVLGGVFGLYVGIRSQQNADDDSHADIFR